MLQQEHHYQNLRPVKFKGYFDYNRNWVGGTEATIGRFHGWATATVRGEKITVALVETQTGQIRTIEPEDLEFLDTEHHVDYDKGAVREGKNE